MKYLITQEQWNFLNRNAMAVGAKPIEPLTNPAIEELAKDAARYRWLRDSEVSQEDQSWIAIGEFDAFGVSAIARNDMDAAIDAAMEST